MGRVQPTASIPLVSGTHVEKGPVTKGRVTILTLEMLRELVKDEEFEIRLTEDEISDRSKGDGLSKLIFVLQSSWFIMQCIARHIQGLDLTQLELTTLAMASLNAITILLWWKKPLGAQAIVHVYLPRTLTRKERNETRVVTGLIDEERSTTFLLPAQDPAISALVDEERNNVPVVRVFFATRPLFLAVLLATTICPVHFRPICI